MVVGPLTMALMFETDLTDLSISQAEIWLDVDLPQPAKSAGLKAGDRSVW